MKRLVKDVFSALGIEIRLIRNVDANREREKRDAVKQKWAMLKRYAPKSILDIGANGGQSAALLLELFPGVPICSFEPLADCFRQVETFLSDNGPGKAFHYALGDATETTTIHRSEFSPSSSLLAMDSLHKSEFPQTANSRLEEIEVRRLDDLADEMSLEPPIVIKVDVQGFEGRVIAGGKETFGRAAALVIELTSYPLYQSQSTFEDVQDQLQVLGFVFRGVIDQMHSPKDGRILQFDALFENAGRISQ